MISIRETHPVSAADEGRRINSTLSLVLCLKCSFDCVLDDGSVFIVFSDEKETYTKKL